MKKYTWVGISIITAGVLLILIFTVLYKPNTPPDSPAVLSPGDSEKGVPFKYTVLSWKCSDPDGDDLHYSVYLGDSPERMDLIATDLTTESLKVSDLKPNTVYYWKVVARDSKGGEREGKVWKFETKENIPPDVMLKSPVDGSVIASSEISLTWEASDLDGDSIKFDVYLGFPSPSLLAKNIKDTAYHVNGLEFGKIYRWKVVAKDDHGGETTSPTWRFAVIEKPKLLKPENGSEVVPDEVTLGWSVRNESAYTFDLFLGKSPDKIKKIASDIKKRSYKLTNLEPSTEYYWRVVSKLGRFASESDVWSFKTSIRINSPPSPPTSPSPADGAVNVDLNPTLSWDCSDVDGDELVYTVYLGVSGSSPTVVASGLTAPVLKLENLSVGTKYIWRVVAYDSKGAYTEGEIWSFTTVATPNSPPSPPTVISPRETENLPTSVKLVWKATDPDGDELSYDLYFGENPNPPLMVSDLKKPEYEVKNLEYNKTYYWYVVAKDPKGATSMSTVRRFKTRIKVLRKPVIDKLLISGGSEGVFLVDVSDPVKPRIVQRVPVYSRRITATSVDVYGKRLNVVYSASTDRLVVLKYADGSISKLTDLLDPNGAYINVKDLDSSNDRVFVSFGISDFGVVDTRYPANPSWLWNVENLHGVVGRVFFSGDEVFVACGTGGVSVISPNGKRVETIDLNANVADVHVVDDLMYIVDFKRGLKIYDISDLSSPKLMSDVPVEGALALTVSATTAYLVGDNGLSVVDVSNPASPDIVSTLDLKGTSRDILVIGPYAYIAGDEFSVVDISDPRNPVKMGWLDFGNFASAVAVSGDVVYVADKRKGLKLFRSEDLSLINELNASDYISDIEIIGDYLYVIDRIDGLMVFDSRTGELLKRIFLPGFAKKIAVGKKIALVVSEFSKRISVIDLKDPSDPELLPSIGFEYSFSDVISLDGDRFVLAGDKILFLNMEDPRNPTTQTSIDLSGVANSVTTSGDYLIVSIDGFGIVFYDISDPSKIESVGSLEIGSPKFVKAYGDLLIVGCSDGVELVDIKSRGVLSKIKLSAPVSDAVLIDSKLYVADSDNGLVAIDVSDTTRPEIIKDVDWLNFYDVDTIPWEEKE